MPTDKWREATDRAELNARRVFPCALLVAAWHDGQFGSRMVCEAEYDGIGFQRRGGGTLGDCVVTHWQWKPEPPPESDMLNVAIGASLGRALTKAKAS